MHESALARQILRIALERLEAEPGATRIRRIRGWIAETEALSADSLAVHFEGLARGTAAEGAALDLRLTHVRARCDACGAVYAPDHHVLLCPDCGSPEATLQGRTGMGIEAIEVLE